MPSASGRSRRARACRRRSPTCCARSWRRLPIGEDAAMKNRYRSSVLRLAACLAGSAMSLQLQAATYPLPAGADTVIGEVQHVVAQHEDTLLDLGRRYGVGYEEIVAANPGVDPWLPGAGTQVLIPSRYILPDDAREGVVVSLAEHRLYYFPRPKAGQPATVETYPISIGKMDWKTPLGLTRIVDKRVRPTWY